MSLYREAGSSARRRRMALGGAALVLGVFALVLVLALRGGPSDEERQQQLQDDVRPALQALELVPIHYESADPITHAAAADQLAVAREAVDGAQDELRRIDPGAARRLAADLDRLAELVPTTGRDAEVERATVAASRELARLVGIAGADG